MGQMSQKAALAVLMALAAGKEKVSDIAAQAGYSEYRTRNALREMERQGRAKRIHYRAWTLAEAGHTDVNNLWITYVKTYMGIPEAHERIVSVIAEAHIMCVSDSQHNAETHKTCASNAQNVRFSLPYDHDDHDHEWMNDIENELKAFGFDRPGEWLEGLGDEKCELVRSWVDRLYSMNGQLRRKIKNVPGFIRRKVEAGESPPPLSAEEERRIQQVKMWEEVVKR